MNEYDAFINYVAIKKKMDISDIVKHLEGYNEIVKNYLCDYSNTFYNYEELKKNKPDLFNLLYDFKYKGGKNNEFFYVIK